MSDFSDVSFSVKMRLGQDNVEEGFNLIPLLNAAPLQHITLHPRLGKQQYKGEVNMEAFRQFADAITHPLIYNGDIHNIADIQRIEQQHPNLKGVMIGRGLLARPSLAIEYAEGKEWDDFKQISLIKRLHNGYYESLSNIIPGETQLLSKLQTFWDYMSEDLLDKKLLKKIRKTGSLNNYLRAVHEL
jgi:tRNA-dihydrouridine synthase